MDAMTFTGPERAQPRWMAQPIGSDTLMRFPAKLDPTQFNRTDAVVVTVGAAGAAADAVSVPVDALSGPIPSGTTISFGGKKFARLTAAAAAGAVTLTVAALPTALVDNDTATYAGDGTHPKRVVSGTYVGRTYTERDAGTGFGPADAADDERYLIPFTVDDVTVDPNCELVRHGVEIKTNFLPVYSALASGVKSDLDSDYVPITGAE
jgi:hypothetical protein